MKQAPYNLLLQTASRDNILTLTTACSTSCIFCSHHQNPPGIEAYSVNRLSFDEVMTVAEFLDKNRKIVIGESATRICEGEPFLYPDILKVLSGIREKFKTTVIQITTSAVPLNGEVLRSIKQLGNIELNVSLNSSTMRGRSLLYGDKPHMQAVEAIQLMKGLEISFNGSIVAMPQLVGLEDIAETVEFLVDCGAGTIRVFVPGFTKYSNQQLPGEKDINSLRSLVVELRKHISVPITLEPEALTSLDAEVAGVVPDSAAYKAGIQIGDIILSVDDETVFSRVDAYYKLFNTRDPKVRYLRGNVEIDTALKKARKASAGLVFSYDIHPDTVLQIKRVLHRHEGKKCLIMTSELAYEIMCKCIEQNGEIKIEKVENRFFGGNIKCAGLLTLEDIVRHAKSGAFKPQVILLPAIVFDQNGRDLTGRNVGEASERLGITIEVI